MNVSGVDKCLNWIELNWIQCTQCRHCVQYTLYTLCTVCTVYSYNLDCVYSVHSVYSVYTVYSVVIQCIQCRHFCEHTEAVDWNVSTIQLRWTSLAPNITLWQLSEYRRMPRSYSGCSSGASIPPRNIQPFPLRARKWARTAWYWCRGSCCKHKRSRILRTPTSGNWKTPLPIPWKRERRTELQINWRL